MSYEFNFMSYEFNFMSYELRFMSYELHFMRYISEKAILLEFLKNMLILSV